MTMLVDVDRLRSFTDGDRQLESELAALFLATAEGYLAELAPALDDAAAWRATAHSLKGAAGNIGAVALAELAAAAEQTPPDAVLLQRLHATLATTRTSLQHHLDSAAEGSPEVPPVRPATAPVDRSASLGGSHVQLARE